MNNVWFINHYAQAPYNFGGTRHFCLAKYLKQQGWDSSIIASSTEINTSKQLIDDKKPYKYEYIDGVHFVRLKTISYKGNGVSRMLNMLQFSLKTVFFNYKALLKKPGIIIGSTIHPFAALAGYILSKYYKIPFIFEVRDLWPQTLVDMGYLREKSLLCKCMRLLELFLAKKSDRIITLLPRAADYYETYGIDTKKIIWIPNGIDFQYFPKLPPKVKQDSNFNFYYFGALGKANNLENLILSMKILNQKENYPNLQLKLVGSGPEKENLIELTKSLNIKNITFFDPVPKSEINLICQQADAFIFNLQNLPVFRFGISSNKLFDFMAGAKPIIFCCEAINNPVSDAQCGITVPPNNPDALAEAMITISKASNEERARMGESGRAYAQNYHNYEVLAHKLSNIMREVINERSHKESF